MKRALIKSFLILFLVALNIGVWGLALIGYEFNKASSLSLGWVFITLGILFTFMMVLVIIGILFFEKLTGEEDE